MSKSILMSVHEHFSTITKRWDLPPMARAWFRGHEDANWKLIPSILRSGNATHEFYLTKRFRLLAAGFGVDIPTSRLDQWLFIMQHNHAPTRLLDWTESLNTALFFACIDWIKQRDMQRCFDGKVFALNPIFLNRHVLDRGDFPPTWIQGPVLQTIKFAFGTEEEVVRGPGGEARRIPYLQLPVAIFPDTVHGRMRAQKACFTLHGKNPSDLQEIFQRNGWTAVEALVEYTISREDKPQLVDDLVMAGTTYSTVFPDLEGLASDLRFQFGIAP